MSKALMSVVVAVRPDLTTFRSEMTDGVTDAAQDSGRALGDEMEKAGSEAGKRSGDAMSKSFASRLKGMENAGRKMSMFVTAPIVGAMGLAVKQASDLGEAVNATNVIFGDAATGVEAWSKNTINSLGLARQTSLGMMNQIGAQMTSQGLAQEQAADMSMKLVERARDIKSLLNAGSTEEVMTAIASGLRGEAEPLRRFGVSLSQAAIEAQALSSGLVQTSADLTQVKSAQLGVSRAQETYAKTMANTKATEVDRQQALTALEIAEAKLATAMEGKAPKLTEAQKIQAAYAIILEQSSAAAGDAANTSGSYANKTEELRERMKELSATYGEVLLPVAEKLLAWANTMAEKFGNLSPSTRKLIVLVASLAATLGPALLIFAKFTQAIMTIRSAMLAMNLAFLANPVTLLIMGLVAAGLVIYKFRNQIWEFLRAVGSTFAEIGRVIAAPFERLGSIIVGVMDKTLGVVKGLINGVLGYYETLINGAVAGINLLVRGINIVNPLEDIPNVPNVQLPRLAKGGNITSAGSVMVGEKGPEILSLPQGARVTPLDKATSATVVNVTGPITIVANDPKELGRQLDRLGREAAARRMRTA
jgi:hypothetical protein